jgi:hypothetical protein
MADSRNKGNGSEPNAYGGLRNPNGGEHRELWEGEILIVDEAFIGAPARN